MSGLHGEYIVVTRPEKQAQALCDMIVQAGGAAVSLPSLCIEPCDNIAQIQATLRAVAHFDYVIFVSANAVNFALQANGGKIQHHESLRFIAIGQATADALHNAGLPVHLMPAHGHDSEALLAMPQLQQVDGQHFLIVRGSQGRETLASTLRARGATVAYLAVYQRTMPQVDTTEVVALLAKHQLAAMTISSGESLDNVVNLLGCEQRTPLLSVPLVVISERIRQLALARGFERVIVAQGPGNSAILETIIIVCNGGECGRIE